MAKILDKAKDNPTVQKVIYGIRPASMGLIAGAADFSNERGFNKRRLI